MVIKYTATTSGNLNAEISALEMRITGSSLALFMQDRIVKNLQERAGDRFAGEGDDAVGGWKPLRPSTINDYRIPQGFGPGPINQRTGDLKKWITNNQGTLKSTLMTATIRFPNQSPTTELRDKLWTAQKGRGQNSRTHDPTVPRPVVGLSSVDAEMSLQSLREWILA